MSLTSKNNEKIGAVNRGTPCESGLCNFCRTDCQGRCETWLSSLLGRRTLVPRDYGNATIGTENTTHVGVSYNALRIRGRVFGGAGLDPEKARTGDAAYCDADLTTTVGSNAKYPCDYPFLIGALSRYTGIRFVLISPDELKVPEYVREDVLCKKQIPFRETTSLEEAMPELDILYMTRVQKERFFNEADYVRLKDSYILTPEKLRHAKRDMCILHPLPRVNEISTAIDADPRACYFKQVLNGKYMRMALILKLLEVK